LDAEKEGKDVAKKYNVTGYPTILFLNTSGEVEGKIGGYMPPESFAPEMTKYIQLHSEFPKVLAKYNGGDHSEKTLSTLAWSYAGRGNITKGEDFLAQAEKAANGSVTAELARAYNAVADSYQEKGQFDKAITLFGKAAKSTDPDAITYARISIAVCYLSQQKNTEAIKELKAVAAMPNATPSYKKQAEDMLKQLGGDSNHK
jgi:pentatricopeptide repeat protein